MFPRTHFHIEVCFFGKVWGGGGGVRKIQEEYLSNFIEKNLTYTSGCSVAQEYMLGKF